MRASGPGADSASRKPLLAGLALFVVLSPLLLGLLDRDLRPEPVYPNQDPSSRTPTLAVLGTGPVDLTLELSRPPDALLIPIWVGDPQQPLRITLTAAGSGVRLAQRTVARSGVFEFSLVAEALEARSLALRFESDAVTNEFAPRLMWSEEASRSGRVRDVTLAGRAIEHIDWLANTGPLLVASYPWPARAWLLLWPALLVPFIWVWRRPHWGPLFLALLSLAAVFTSTLLWQRDYSRVAQHIDADQFTQSAHQMARYLLEPAERPRIADWYRQYPHASNSLVPALMAIPIALGAVPHLVYLQLSALSSFLALLLLWRVLTAELALAPRTALSIVSVLACHLLVLRSFARPLTDSFGLLLVVALLWLLLRRMRTATLRDDLGLGLLMLLCALARPQGVAYWLFVAPALVGCSRLRGAGATPWRALALEQLRIFLPPLALLAGLYLYFDWFHNVESMLDKAQRFRVNSTAAYFFPSLVGVVQLLPILWLRAGKRLREPAALLVIAWSGFNLALLLAVRAPFWMRHFLPLLPAVAVLCGLGLERLRGRERSAALALLASTMVLNIVAIAYQIHTLGPLSPAIAGFISTP